ncbi:N-acetyltransferase family protein [Streptomyces xiamenensis]|uniref:GCN5-related N-acetyltransferase n=1 Tax=Streptomyces xiamenensis TaxID=408015 RepID=A0A0F7FUV6_9ACTN|nr:MULTISPECIES: GNAT family N-acetyltransferase [Streptomyces]AKG43628.1 GCN5-related N-acetyltransferase [Streptomyces xiamenensis]
MDSSDPYTIRRTRREDWARLRELRLAALRDPLAGVAFYQTHEAALEIPREEWERRAAGARTVTFIGETGEHRPWAGMVSVYPEPDPAADHVVVVGVYVRPEHRGTGMAAELMEEAIAWAGDREIRLRVHENNPRAARFYASLGFLPNGRSHVDPRAPGTRALELTLSR